MIYKDGTHTDGMGGQRKRCPTCGICPYGHSDGDFRCGCLPNRKTDPLNPEDIAMAASIARSSLPGPAGGPGRPLWRYDDPDAPLQAEIVAACEAEEAADMAARVAEPEPAPIEPGESERRITPERLEAGRELFLRSLMPAKAADEKRKGRDYSKHPSARQERMPGGKHRNGKKL